MNNLKVEVSIKDIEIINILKEMVEDKRISEEVRTEYIEKLDNTINRYIYLYHSNLTEQ